MTLIRLIVRWDDGHLNFELFGPWGRSAAGPVKGVHLEAWRARQVESPQTLAPASAGMESLRVELMQQRVGALLWDSAPRPADRIASLSGTDLTIAVEIEAPPRQAHLLHLIPWELLPWPGRDRTRPLVGPRCEVVRILPPVRRSGHLATEVRELTSGGDLVFQAGVFSSPLCGSVGAGPGLEAFNAAPIARFLERTARVGFLRPGTTEYLSDATWTRFTSMQSVVKFFFGHGNSTPDGDATLSFFSDVAGTWSREEIAARALHELLSSAKESVLGLIACHSYRTLAAALGEGAAVAPSVVATLAAVPLEPMLHAWRDGLQALSVHNDALRMVGAMRRCLRQRAPEFERYIVLFHQPGDADLAEVSFQCAPGLSRVVDLSAAAGLGWSGAEYGAVLARKVDLGLSSPCGYRRAGPAPSHRLRVAVHPITHWQMALVFPTHQVPSGQDCYPAQVSLEQAQQYAAAVGGRLLTADEWEACASRVRCNGMETRIDAALAVLARSRGPYQTYEAPQFTGPRDPVSVTHADGMENANGLRQMIGGSWEWTTDTESTRWMGGSWDVGVGDCLPQWRRDPFGRTAAFRVAWEV